MPSPARAPVPDNLRGLLLLLVGAGHGLEPLLGGSPTARALYGALYLFHVPAFAALSGWVSRPAWPGVEAWWALLWPLLAGQVLYAAVEVLALGHGLSWSWLWQPHWVLWFLLSLACWRALLPLLVRTRWPLAWAVGASLAAGALPWVGYPLSLSRTLVFLPCFMAGHLAPGWLREWLRGRAGRRLSLGLFALLGVWALAVAQGALPAPDTRLLYGSTGYELLGLSKAAGAALRAGVLALSLAYTAAAWSLAPGAAGWLSRLGAATLWPYVLHGMFLRALPWGAWLAALPGWSQVPAGVSAGLLAVLLPGAWAARTRAAGAPSVVRPSPG